MAIKSITQRVLFLAKSPPEKHSSGISWPLAARAWSLGAGVSPNHERAIASKKLDEGRDVLASRQSVAEER